MPSTLVNMKAILWDGNKQLHGELILGKKRIRFELADFKDTDLDFDLTYGQIKDITYQSIFDSAQLSIKITSCFDRSNVFVVDDPMELRRRVELKIKNLAIQHIKVK